MPKAKQSAKEAKKVPVKEEVQANENVVVHLDRDPNDPRNNVEAGPLPSL